VLICGECFSANLGDGVIAVSLRELVRKAVPDSSVDFFDLSGRRGYVADRAGTKSQTEERTAKSFHRRIYARSYYYSLLVNLLRIVIVNRFGDYHSRLDAALSQSDYVLIGGGQLLQDNRLAFPLMLRAVVRAARRRRIPVSFFSVGVGANWSTVGKAIMRNVLGASNVESIVCRDKVSFHRIQEIFPVLKARLDVTFDVALALSGHAHPSHDVDSPVGLCLMHPKAMRWAVNNHPLASSNQAVHYWVELCRVLTSEGLSLALFTNGAPDDDTFAHKVAAQCKIKLNSGDRIRVRTRPHIPEDLVSTISRFEVVVAHRLHANIISTALAIPCIALECDLKVKEFMTYSGQADRFMRVNSTVSDVAAKVFEVMDNPVVSVSMSRFSEKILSDLGRVLTSAPRIE